MRLMVPPSAERISKLRAGYRDHPPADMEAICATLIKIGALLADLPQSAELDRIVRIFRCNFKKYFVMQRGIAAILCAHFPD